MRYLFLFVMAVMVVGCRHQKPPELLQPGSLIFSGNTWWITTPTDPSDTILRIDAPKRDLRCYLNRDDEREVVITCAKIGSKP
jgi:hypothetical protein